MTGSGVFDRSGHLAGARRLVLRGLRALARRALRGMRGVLAGMALSFTGIAGMVAAASPEGHCMAASPTGGCVETRVADLRGNLLPGIHARFAEPTTRYAHGVLGDAVEWGRLIFVQQPGAAGGAFAAGEVVLPQERVFEDLRPRLYDLDRDGTLDVVVVESDARLGAQLAVYAMRDGVLTKIAATPPIGRSFRWLAPLGAADLDGDGAIEIAYIDRPHLAKVLRVWRFAEGRLTEVAHRAGLTNHKIGEAFISGGLRACQGRPEIITADAAWRDIIATRLSDGVLQSRVVARFDGPASFRPVLSCE